MEPSSTATPKPPDLPLPVGVDPLKPSRNLIEIFLLLLCVWASVQLIFSQPLQQAHVSLWIAVGWRLMLVVAPLLIFLGMWWKGKSYTANKQQEIGYIALATASAVYGVIVYEWVTFIFAFFAMGRAIQIAHEVEKLFPGSSAFHRMWRRVRKLWLVIWYER